MCGVTRTDDRFTDTKARLRLTVKWRPAPAFKWHQRQHNEYYIKGVIKRDFGLEGKRAKTPVQHARAAEVLKKQEMAFPRRAATTKKNARRRGRERHF